VSKASFKNYDFGISYGPADDRLRDFYIPALSRSIRYDRSAGYFSSSALAVAAAGVARLISNNGKMRLLAGADLKEQDIAAIQKGHDLSEILKKKFLSFLHDPEELAKQRLEVLAWMVANDTLKIKVVLPQKYGKPIPAPESLDYYHPKEGIFSDFDGNQIAFSGSVNESAHSWEKNYEQFAVYKSWDASQPYLKQVKHRFERLWNGKEPDWIALPIPEAVTDQLIKFKPQKAPIRDPLESVKPLDFAEQADIKEQLLFQFLRDAPYLPNGRFLANETATVRLWPHQKITVEDVVSKFPARFLLCSEVGLGKTIEAGMALRQLVLSGKVRRCLILTPKSVARQWQEELYEKVSLNIPLYSEKIFTDYFHNILPQKNGNPWKAHPVMIASSQLAKRKERQEELLSAGPWDLIIIDEAHHARRKDFLEDRRRSNRLLELLEGTEKLPGLAAKTKGLILLTATPMQVHPVEVWDLIKNLDLGGRWEASDEHFLRFFEELRKPYERVDWKFVLNMFEDSLATGTELDPIFAKMAEERLGPVEWEQIRYLARSTRKPVLLKQFSRDGRLFLTDMVKRHTPLRRLLKRSTRKLLHRYKEKGILKDSVPKRSPKSVWVPLAEDERRLYDRIEEYFSEFYQRYESERKGLGFVMTVYRRRLTSSFYAVEKSLERRLAFLKGQIVPEALQGLTEEELEQEELSFDIGEEIDEGQKFFSNEIEYVEDFLSDLRKLKGDSKWEQIHDDVKEILKSHDTLVIFTHYTDTMDYLREQLRQAYGSQVACYSGRGGEIWNGYQWILRSKEEIKNAFRKARDIKILLCTDAASEGLNLQTCSVLINYDMPWNPMRAEQRIGRIDRIGGHPVVFIRNYFYQDTVEARVYQALSKRIDLFEWVIGELQPILSGIERTIQELALMHKAQRKTRIEEAIHRLNQEYDEQVAQGLKLDDYLLEEVRSDLEDEPPLSMKDLEKVLTQSPALSSYWKKESEVPNAWILKIEYEEMSFTFDHELFDRYPETFRLMTYGEPVLETLFEMVRPLLHPGKADLPLVRYAIDNPEPIVAYYVLDENEAKPIKTLEELQKILEHDPPDNGPGKKAEQDAKAQFEFIVKECHEKAYEKKQTEHRCQLFALEEQGRQFLVKSALCDISQAQQPSLFDQSPIIAGFDEDTIQRFKTKGFPFAPLFHLIDTEGLKPELTDPYWLKVQGRSEREVRGIQDYLKRQIKSLVENLSKLKNIEVKKPEMALPSVLKFYSPNQKEKPKLTLISSPPQEEWFIRYLPVYTLKAAAGYFGEGEAVEPEGWVEVDEMGKLDDRMFVACAVGRSMEPKIQNGDYLVFRANPVGSRDGKIVLVQYRGPEDPETGGAYTVKKYRSEKVSDEEGGWRHKQIILSPLNSEFLPIILEEDEAGSVKVVAEYVATLSD